ncbi:MAG: hypothetical protein AABZ60_03990 [Planctomycetota bacterium]
MTFFLFIEAIGIFLMVVCSFLVMLSLTVYFAFFPEERNRLQKRILLIYRGTHDRFLSGITKRNLEEEELNKKIVHWVDRGNCLELHLLIKKHSSAHKKIMSRLESKQDYLLGVQLADKLQDPQLKQDFYRKIYAKALAAKDYFLAIDFAKKIPDYKAAYELMKTQIKEVSHFMELGEMAEKAEAFEEAIAYYQKENALYEIARLLIRQHQIDRLFDYCKDVGHKKVAVMVLAPLKEAGLAEEAEHLKQKLIAYEATTSH